jgi:hypothetical protein
VAQRGRIGGAEEREHQALRLEQCLLAGGIRGVESDRRVDVSASRVVPGKRT